ncbi:DUF2971 domain-containing protein [Vibrio fluvialis]|uniref:DUF2971 domain-containing protein n=1 Tax=Vibrio fluvialis TaxID=676 RepID=UPI001BB0CB98|nr:DUF2971 domain-containing protein [Vibrio fluvialis]QUF68501.1 DUF2971 domain-containing protein [Vibrio fluvialis]
MRCSPFKRALYFSEDTVIHSIFKYMPARVEFFDNLLLRASHKTALNDPFEVRPSLGFIADLCISHNCSGFGRVRHEIIENLRGKKTDQFWVEIELALPLYEYHGIMCFTEKNDNLLMWSHYSDQHKGIVIEFDHNHPFFTKPKSGYGLQPVLYRKTRVGKLGKSSPIEPYFHKSKEWAYEQEHRLLVCLSDADVNLIPKGYFPDCPDCIDKYDSKHIKWKDCEVFNAENDLLKVNSDVDYSIVANEPNFMAMFQVPSKAIKSVYFGTLIDQVTKVQILEKLQGNELKHIKKYQAYIDPFDYSLKMTEI